jgi:hypothetical protein
MNFVPIFLGAGICKGLFVHASLQTKRAGKQTHKSYPIPDKNGGGGGYRTRVQKTEHERIYNA